MRFKAVLLLVVLLTLTPFSTASASPSAGLYWGPVYVGNLKLAMTNQHFGYAGPKVGHTDHVNFHVDRRGTWGYDEVANFHITKSTGAGGKTCIYIWDSETRRVVFDNCMDNFTTVARSAAQAAKDFVGTLLGNADWIAFLAIAALVVVVLVALILSIPAVVLASEPPVTEIAASSTVPQGTPPVAAITGA